MVVPVDALLVNTPVDELIVPYVAGELDHDELTPVVISVKGAEVDKVQMEATPDIASGIAFTV